MQVQIQAKFSKTGNIKLGGAVWAFSKLYGNKDIFVRPLMATVSGTCGSYCQGCESDCYVRKSYRYPSVVWSHARNTLAFRDDLSSAFFQLSEQLRRAKNKPNIVRINQSGELESLQELIYWGFLASLYPNTQFYIYTKAYNLAAAALEKGAIPENMTILISVWHDFGLAEYAALDECDNVKAFVYDDFAFDYAAHGLQIGTSCHAYDSKGKLDHSVTCDKCRKCFNRSKAAKVIRCAAH